MSQQRQKLVEEGLDAYLQRIGKDLPVGSKVRLRLIQGPLPQSSIDPIETTSSTSGGGNNTMTTSIPKQSFPSILKFPPSSTQPPNFTKSPWNNGKGRLHIENIPKPLEDSDDEDNVKGKASTSNHGTSNSNTDLNGGDGSSSAIGENASSAFKTINNKKRWKYNRNVAPAKQWTLQDQVDFLETMVYRRKLAKYQKLLAQYNKAKRSHPNDLIHPPTAPIIPPIRSTRYVGIPERMTSNNVLFSLQQKSLSSMYNDRMDDDDDDDDDRNTATIIVRALPDTEQPILIPMTQPAVRSHTAFATLSNAAQVMEDQRFAMSTTAASLAFRNKRPKLGNNSDDPVTTDLPLRVGGIRKINTTQSRLLQKLQLKEKSSVNKQDDEEDGDDVMADVAFKERKGSGGGARRELLSTLGDGLKVSDDGAVLGGTNDALFGGRGLHFNRVATSVPTDAGQSSNDNMAERNAEGAAMADDFYSRDVSAEYEQMDYDAQEQFDDDDVDVGETEVQKVGNDGYNDDDDDIDDNDNDSDDINDDDDDDDAIGGVEGLASTAGYKALLAKARGELVQGAITAEKAADESRASSPTNTNMTTTGPNNVTAPTSSTAASLKNGDDTGLKRSNSPKPDKGKNGDDGKPIDHIARKIAAAKTAAQVLQEKQKPKDSAMLSNSNNNGIPPVDAAVVSQVDEQGLRLITLDAVRREIWLNHGSIPINRLMKIFNANKKYGEARQNKLKEAIKELCTMTMDPINGRTLVLKQHYSHMD
jgi:hypothetical protein